MKKLFIVGIIVLSVMLLSSCTFDLMNAQKTENNVKLYERHNEFIKVVKYNLGIPDKDTITYDLENPVVSSGERETVKVSFSEKGEIVAQAKCYTDNGDIAQQIKMYKEASADAESSISKDSSSESVMGAKKELYVKYNSYTNARFGYTINYPDFLIAQPESDNGDGRRFVSGDGETVLTVWGSWTGAVFEEASTLDGYYNYVERGLNYTPTYKTKGNNFFVFSGYKGDKIVYEKHFLKSDGCECSFVIEYPASTKQQYDDIVTYISNNMRIGAGASSSASK